MVRKAAALVLVAIILLSTFAGCEIFLEIFALSPFPGYLAQAVASVGMRAEIQTYVGDNNAQWRSDVHVLRNVAGAEYVFLIIRKDYGGQRVYAFNTDLKMISFDSVNSHSPINLVDANDDFVVGNVTFDHTDLTSTTPEFPNVPVNWEDHGFSQGPPVSRNFILRTFGNTLEYEEFLDTWGSVGTASAPLGTPYDMWLRGVGFDPGVTDPLVGINPVYLIYVAFDPDRDDEFLQIVRTPAIDYSSGLSSPLFSMYPVSSRVYGVRGNRYCYYTRKGVVAESQDRGRYLLTTLNGSVTDRFWITAEEEPALDFDIDGEYYYIFDERDMRLYKAVTGF